MYQWEANRNPWVGYQIGLSQPTIASVMDLAGGQNENLPHK